MILKVVTHSLKAGMQEQFRAWFSTTQQQLCKIPGFLEAVYFENKEQPETIALLLYFQNDQALSLWLESKAHEKALAAIETIIAKPWQIQSLEIS